MDWVSLVDCLWDESHEGFHKLPGICLVELVDLSFHDYDEIDRMMIDSETKGA